MATRRDGSPKKGKIALSPNRATATSAAPPKTKLPSTRPAIGNTSAHDVHKQAPAKKPTTTGATTRKSLDKAPIKPSPHSREIAPPRKTPAPTGLKTPSPARKIQAPANPTLQSHVKTTPAPRKPSPSLQPPDKTPMPARKTQAKSVASQKTALGKRLKALLQMPAALKTSNAQVITAPKTEEPTNQENDENLNIYQNLPEVETLLEDQELDTFSQQQDADNNEPEEHVINVDGITDSAPEEDQEKSLEIEAENHEEEKIVTTVEPSPAPVDVKTQEPEEKLLVEEKLEEHSGSGDYHGEEDDEKKVEVIEKGKVADLNEDDEKKDEVIEKVEVNEAKEDDEKKDEVTEKSEVADLSEAHVSGETKEPEVAAKKHTWQPEKKVEKQGFAVRKEFAVSNNAIEETATKLREQRKSRVRALAGAFESVMH